eukprot:jgi/Chrzof1/457/Cz01g16160.t1
MAEVDEDVRAQLGLLQQQNTELLEALQTREQEIQALKEVAEAQGELQSQDVQAAKIIELSKKNRNLNLAFEGERRKVAKLQQALSEATQSPTGHAAQKIQQAARSVVEQAAEAADTASKEAAVWKERLQQLTNKASQMEQKAFVLEADNKKLTRALLREVGEDVPLAKLLDHESSDWKGRREQIIALKDQIRQLKEAQGQAAPSKHDAKHKFAISNISKERTAEMERMAAELVDAKSQCEQLRLQYGGAASRRNVLEAEVSSLKQKLGLVLNKTKNDDKLIKALRSELALAAKGVVKGGGSNSNQEAGLWAELTELRQRCGEQEEQIDKQQKIILHLQAQSSQPNRRDALMQEQLEALQDENEELHQQVKALQDDLKSAEVTRPGTSGTSAALRQQMLALQEDNDHLRGQVMAMQQQHQTNSPSKPNTPSMSQLAQPPSKPSTPGTKPGTATAQKPTTAAQGTEPVTSMEPDLQTDVAEHADEDTQEQADEDAAEQVHTV